MAIYVIGDVQGCHDELQALLVQVCYTPEQDQLWFVGDLVNRGPQSLHVLRFVKNLGPSARCVLGNHDLHLLAVAAGCGRYRDSDTFEDVLAAPDRDELLSWLSHVPLLHHDAVTGCTMIHAGLPPQWDLAQATACAAEVEAVLRGSTRDEFLRQMYGNEPSLWSDELRGMPRWRFITNCFTRLRYCDAHGRLALAEKAAPGSQPAQWLPWFAVPQRRSQNLNLLFGHWSTLGTYSAPGLHALDTGCVWGGSLSALRIDGQEYRRVSVTCNKQRAAC